MIRLISALILSLLFFVFVLQNLKAVQLNFLFWQFSGSLALILILTFITAVIISLLVSIPLYMKKLMYNRRSKEAKEKKKPSV